MRHAKLPPRFLCPELPPQSVMKLLRLPKLPPRLPKLPPQSVLKLLRLPKLPPRLPKLPSRCPKRLPWFVLELPPRLLLAKLPPRRERW